MKRTFLLSVVSAVALSIPVSAQEANPAFWLLMPLAGQIAACASQGPDMQNRLDQALQTARSNAPKLLPASAWEIMRIGLTVSNEKKSNLSTVAHCEEAVAMFRHPQFSKHLRQMFAAQFTTSAALECIVQQPSTGPAIKKSWLDAYTRNGFEISEADIDQSTDTAREYVKSTKGHVPPLAECQRLPTELFGKKFDSQYSEQGIYQLFSGKQ